MKILVIDRDEMTSQMIASRLEAEGHHIAYESGKQEGLNRIEKEDFDLIFVDPSPMKDAKAMALNIRRASKLYPYIIWLTHETDPQAEDVMAMGCNDYVSKPLDQAEIHRKVENAQRLKDLFDKLGSSDEDFPSAGGVISKSAFNQLCLSAMDRGGRYNELAFVMAISIENYKEILSFDGKYSAEFSVSKMAHHMVRLRRRSDIVGQTGKNEYSILLQRTENTKEALDAAQRFAVTFDEIDDFLPVEGNEIKIRIHLTHLPTGDCPFDHTLAKKLKIPER
ncbi:MAG: response regulator [Alphaproteobacteria bacterium]